MLPYQYRDVIVIHYEASAGTRLIFTDGRPLPDRNRLLPDNDLIEWVCENEQSTQYFDQ